MQGENPRHCRLSVGLHMFDHVRRRVHSLVDVGHEVLVGDAGSLPTRLGNLGGQVRQQVDDRSAEQWRRPVEHGDDGAVAERQIDDAANEIGRVLTVLGDEGGLRFLTHGNDLVFGLLLRLLQLLVHLIHSKRV